MSNWESDHLFGGPVPKRGWRFIKQGFAIW